MIPRLALLALASLVLSACSGSGPGPSRPATPAAAATPAPPSPAVTSNADTTATAPTVPTSTTFTSAMYGYVVTLPPGWYTGAAFLRWDGASEPGYDDPAVDKLVGPGTASAFAFGGPTSDDLDGFVRDTIKWTVRDHGDTCPGTKPDANEPISIGGEKGRLLAWSCGIFINQAVTVRGATSFTFVLRDPGVLTSTDPTNRALFQQLLDSVVFGS